MEKQILNENRILAAASYAVGLPAIYILLTEKRRDEFLFFHAAQAMFVWIGIIIAWMLMRILLGLIWNVIYIPFLDNVVSLLGFAMWLYALYFAVKAFRGQFFEISRVSDIIKKIVK